MPRFAAELTVGRHRTEQHMTDVEQRLMALEFEIRMSESRIRRDIMERDRAWRDWVITGVPLFANLLAKVAQPAPPRPTADHEPREPGRLPLVPDLEPRPITMEEYYAYAPEKVELLGGYVFGSPAYPESARKTLLVLLTNMGLVEAVKVVPEVRWRAALERAYGPSR